MFTFTFLNKILCILLVPSKSSLPKILCTNRGATVSGGSFKHFGWYFYKKKKPAFFSEIKSLKKKNYWQR